MWAILSNIVGKRVQNRYKKVQNRKRIYVLLDVKYQVNVCVVRFLDFFRPKYPNRVKAFKTTCSRYLAIRHQSTLFLAFQII